MTVTKWNRLFTSTFQVDKMVPERKSACCSNEKVLINTTDADPDNCAVPYQRYRRFDQGKSIRAQSTIRFLLIF